MIISVNAPRLLPAQPLVPHSAPRTDIGIFVRSVSSDALCNVPHASIGIRQQIAVLAAMLDAH